MRLLLLFFIGCFVVSCQSIQPIVVNGKSVRSVEEYISESDQIENYFFGFQLYDLEEQKVVASQNAQKFFTPASNTKLFTLYTALHYLQDSLAFVNVYNDGGTKIYQPLGDPSFLHPDLQTSNRIQNYFKNVADDTIRFSLSHFKDKRFGSGWAWGDYSGYYQTEKSAFPIQSNLLIFNEGHSTTHWMPILIFDEQKQSNTLDRLEYENTFLVDPELVNKRIPFHVTNAIYEAYFRQQGKEVLFDVEISPTAKLLRTIYSSPIDSTYKVLMQSSDNHIAEQLLLQASQLEFGEMSTQQIIAKAKEELFAPIEKELNWIDGSGLSRYNMMTPNAVNWVVNALVNEKGIDWITEIFPAGGKSGTIKNYYAFDESRVFAKTGTLRNNHCLSGIVQAKSGKWYSFSMMNNHFPGSSSITKQEMEAILTVIVERY